MYYYSKMNLRFARCLTAFIYSRHIGLHTFAGASEQWYCTNPPRRNENVFSLCEKVDYTLNIKLHCIISRKMCIFV